MNLNEANHVITKAAEMLDNLQESGVIDMATKRALLPVVVAKIFEQAPIMAEYTAP